MTYGHKIRNELKSYLQKDMRVSQAWLFGLVSRGEQRNDSDIDVMIEMNNDKPYTLFDFFEIQYNFEKITNKKVDLVEKNYIKPLAWETAQNDLIPIL